MLKKLLKTAAVHATQPGVRTKWDVALARANVGALRTIFDCTPQWARELLVNQRNPVTLDTPLIVAITGRSLSFSVELIQSGADPTLRNQVGCTPLMAAAKTDSNAVTEIVGLLREPDILATDKEGRSALMWAALSGNLLGFDALFAACPSFGDDVGGANFCQRLCEAYARGDVPAGKESLCADILTRLVYLECSIDARALSAARRTLAVTGSGKHGTTRGRVRHLQLVS